MVAVEAVGEGKLLDEQVRSCKRPVTASYIDNEIRLADFNPAQYLFTSHCRKHFPFRPWCPALRPSRSSAIVAFAAVAFSCEFSFEGARFKEFHFLLRD